MPFIPEQLLAREFLPKEHRYNESDSMLYALSCGLGSDPLDAGQLRYVYERAATGLQTLPTLANVLGYFGFWADAPDAGITWRKLLHAEQQITLLGPLPPSGHIIGYNNVVGLHDKGEKTGAIMLQERRIVDASSGALIATTIQTTILRADGGFGAKYGPSHGMALIPKHTVPDRPADAVWRSGHLAPGSASVSIERRCQSLFMLTLPLRAQRVSSPHSARPSHYGVCHACSATLNAGV